MNECEVTTKTHKYMPLEQYIPGACGPLASMSVLNPNSLPDSKKVSSILSQNILDTDKNPYGEVS